MKPLYVILSIAGWVWLVVLAGYVIYKLRKNSREAETRGFDPDPKSFTPKSSDPNA